MTAEVIQGKSLLITGNPDLEMINEETQREIRARRRALATSIDSFSPSDTTYRDSVVLNQEGVQDIALLLSQLGIMQPGLSLEGVTLRVEPFEFQSTDVELFFNRLETQGVGLADPYMFVLTLRLKAFSNIFDNVSLKERAFCQEAYFQSRFGSVAMSNEVLQIRDHAKTLANCLLGEGKTDLILQVFDAAHSQFSSGNVRRITE